MARAAVSGGTARPSRRTDQSSARCIRTIRPYGRRLLAPDVLDVLTGAWGARHITGAERLLEYSTRSSTGVCQRAPPRSVTRCPEAPGRQRQLLEGEAESWGRSAMSWK